MIASKSESEKKQMLLDLIKKNPGLEQTVFNAIDNPKFGFIKGMMESATGISAEDLKSQMRSVSNSQSNQPHGSIDNLNRIKKFSSKR